MPHDVSHELRGPNGEWVSSPGGRMPSHDQKPVLKKVRAKRISNTPFEGEPIYSRVYAAYGWADRDAIGSDGRAGTGASIKIQGKAQIHAKTWEESEDTVKDSGYAKALWSEYQDPTAYGEINTALRTGKQGNGPPPADLRRYAKMMFDQGGYTAPSDMTVYRALKSDSGTMDWKATLKPGSVFEDDGMISATAHPRFAQGWLRMGFTDDGTVAGAPRETEPNDVVVEVRVPAGTRILGGDPQFIETMLQPGTKFKVISSETRRADKPIVPVGDTPALPFTYTHVIVEAVQP